MYFFIIPILPLILSIDSPSCRSIHLPRRLPDVSSRATETPPAASPKYMCAFSNIPNYTFNNLLQPNKNEAKIQQLPRTYERSESPGRRVVSISISGG